MKMEDVNRNAKVHADGLEKIREDVRTKKEAYDKAINESKKTSNNLTVKEDEIRTNTDFKELGITNDKGRNSYINNQPEIQELKETLREKEDDVQKIRRELEDLENTYRDARIIERLSIALLSFEET